MRCKNKCVFFLEVVDKMRTNRRRRNLFRLSLNRIERRNLLGASILLHQWHLEFSLFSYLILRLRRESLVCSRAGFPFANPAGKRNNRLRSTCEMAPSQCLLFHPTSARMKFARPSVELTIELRHPSNFFLPLTRRKCEKGWGGSWNSDSISNLYYDEKETGVNWKNI